MLNKSNVERSNPSGEGQAIRSAGAMPNSAADQRTNAATARCDSTTPFGRPADPDVNRITAASSGKGVAQAGGEVFGAPAVAQALLPAASALMPTLAFDTVSRPRKGAETS